MAQDAEEDPEEDQEAGPGPGQEVGPGQEAEGEEADFQVLLLPELHLPDVNCRVP